MFRAWGALGCRDWLKGSGLWGPEGVRIEVVEGFMVSASVWRVEASGLRGCQGAARSLLVTKTLYVPLFGHVWGFSKSCGVSYNKNQNILGSIFGSPYSEKLPDGLL